MGGSLEDAFRDWLTDEGGRRTPASSTHPADGRSILDRRLESIGWGLLFFLLAAFALPSGPVEYAVVATIGGLIVGLNAVRLAASLPISWFGVVLGTALLVAGSGALLGYRLDAFVVFFVLAGVVTIAGAIIRPRPAVD